MPFHGFFTWFLNILQELSNALQNKLQASGLLIANRKCYIEITEKITQKHKDKIEKQKQIK